MDKDHGQGSAKTVTGDELSAGDESIWRLWLQGVAMADPRSHSKAIAWLARLAMTDEAFRTKLINDPKTALKELPSDLSPPEGMTLRFLENTQDTLNVVLPPRAGEAGSQPRKFFELLKSRTLPPDGAFLSDDFNIGPGRDPDFRD